MEIPVWGIGVAAICAGVGLMIALMQLGEGLARSLFGAQREAARREHHGPSTVIGMHVGSSPATPQPEALEDLQRRVAELEERLDFAERVLAQRPEPEKLHRPR